MILFLVISYPTYIEQGALKRQHLIVFFRAELDEAFRASFPCFPLSTSPSSSPHSTSTSTIPPLLDAPIIETASPANVITIQGSELDMVAWVALDDLFLLDSLACSNRSFTVLSFHSYPFVSLDITTFL